MSESTDRFDLLVVCEQMEMRVARGVAESWLRQLLIQRVATPVDESVAHTWVEVYMEAGPSAHEPFVTHAYDGVQPVFLEAVIRFGSKPVRLPYGPKDQEVTFYFEFKGCVFDEPLGPFKQRFQKAFGKRPAFFVQKHVEIGSRSDVPEGEEPVEKNRRSGKSGGLVGTRVEEF